MIRPIIEVYFDPNGMIGEKLGCYRSRLCSAHGCRGVGENPIHAVSNLLRTIISFKDLPRYAHLPSNLGAYKIVRLDSKERVIFTGPSTAVEWREVA